MAKLELVVPPDDVAKWSSPHCHEPGVVSYECGFGIDPAVHQDQSAVAQNSVILSAASGICLVIAAYSPRWKLGLLVHLNREPTLNADDADLIRKPFEQFPQLRDEVIVGFISSAGVQGEYAVQLDQARALILSVAPTAEFRDVLVEGWETSADEDLAPDNPPMSVDVFLDTKTGTIRLNDEYGEDRLVKLTK